MSIEIKHFINKMFKFEILTLVCITSHPLMFFIVVTDNQITQGRSWGIKMLQSVEVFIQSYNLLIAKFTHIYFLRASLVAQRLKRLPPMQETRVRSLGREDPLEKKMAIHCSILAWRIPWSEKPSRLQSTGSQIVRHD